MVVLDEKTRVSTIIGDMVEAARERKNHRSPLVRERSGKAVDAYTEVKRKGALYDEKKYNRVREAFDQNYRKLNPLSSQESLERSV